MVDSRPVGLQLGSFPTYTVGPRAGSARWISGLVSCATCAKFRACQGPSDWSSQTPSITSPRGAMDVRTSTAPTVTGVYFSPFCRRLRALQLVGPRLLPDGHHYHLLSPTDALSASPTLRSGLTGPRSRRGRSGSDRWTRSLTYLSSAATRSMARSRSSKGV